MNDIQVTARIDKARIGYVVTLHEGRFGFPVLNIWSQPAVWWRPTRRSAERVARRVRERRQRRISSMRFV